MHDIMRKHGVLLTKCFFATIPIFPHLATFPLLSPSLLTKQNQKNTSGLVQMKWTFHFWNRVSLNIVTDVPFYFKKCIYDISPLHFNIDIGVSWRNIPILQLLWQHASSFLLSVQLKMNIRKYIT